MRSLPLLMIPAPPPEPVAGTRGRLVCLPAVRAAGGGRCLMLGGELDWEHKGTAVKW